MRPDLELLRNLIDATAEIAPRPGAGKPPAAVRAAEAVVGPLSPSYRWWLTAYGEGTFARQEVATVRPFHHIGGVGIGDGWSGGDRLPFLQDGDGGDGYAFALDAAGPGGEHPVVRRDPFVGEEEPFADSFAGFLTVRTALLRGLREGPNPAVARLWRPTPGVRLPDGGAVYGPHVLRVRNDAHGIPARAPHWVLIGDDGAGDGLFMRRHGRDRESVHRLALADVAAGSFDGDVAAVGAHVTGDLLGWIDDNRAGPAPADD